FGAGVDGDARRGAGVVSAAVGDQRRSRPPPLGGIAGRLLTNASVTRQRSVGSCRRWGRCRVSLGPAWVPGGPGVQVPLRRFATWTPCGWSPSGPFLAQKWTRLCPDVSLG